MRRLYENSTSEEIMRRGRELDLFNSTFLRTPPPCYDPIFTPIFTTIFGSITIGTTGITVASVASAIATTALTMGLQAMLAPKPPKPEDGKAPLTQAVPYRIYGYGETRISGVRALWEAKGSNLCIVQALCAHPIVEFTRFYFNDDIVTADPGTGKVNPLANGRYGKGGAWLYSRIGSNPGVPYDRVIELLGDGDVWTETHRGDNQATMAIVAQNPRQQDYAQSFPYGAPAGSAVAKLRKVWDYRISPDPTNPAAQVFSKNSALIMAHHQCLNPYGHRRDYTKAILPILDMWIEEADICDEDVLRAGGGSEKRYEFNIWDTTENGPKTTTNAILASCDGWICERGDKALLFTVGKFRESRCGVITDADIAGYDFDEDVLFEDEINRIVPKFNYPETDYSTADTDFFDDIDAQLIAGRILSSEMDLRGVQQWRQARRLAKREFLRRKAKKSGSNNIWMCGINSVYKRWNRLDTPIFLPDLNGEIVENANSILAVDKGGFSMNWRLHPENLEEWAPETDEGQQPPVPPKPNAAGIVTPVINLIQAKPNGSSVYIRIDIVDPEDDSLYPVVRYQVANDGSGSPGEWLEKPFPKAEPTGGYYKLNTDVVPSDKLLNIQVAFIGGNGKYGDWTLNQTVTSTVDPVAPLSLTAFTQTAAAPHLGNAVFGLTTKNDSHVKAVKLYRKAPGVALNVAVDTPFDTLSVAASATYSYTDGDATRVNALSNGDFATDTVWSKNSGWTISGGKANRSGVGISSTINQTMAIASGDVVRGAFTVSTISAGNVRARISNAGGSPLEDAPDHNVAGTHMFSLTAGGTRDAFGLRGDASFVGAADDTIAYKQTPACIPQGTWDYYAVPFNGSNVAGPASGPVAVTII